MNTKIIFALALSVITFFSCGKRNEVKNNESQVQTDITKNQNPDVTEVVEQR